MKNVIITGASSGVGAAVAKELAKLNYSLGLIVRNKAKGEQVKREIIAQTGNEKLTVFIADLSKPKEVQKVEEEIKLVFPVIDVLINNAGLNINEHFMTEDG